MKASLLLVLVWVTLPTLLFCFRCSDGPTKASGCFECSDSNPESECLYCNHHFYKTSTNFCTECPDGTGRTTPNVTTEIEPASVCLRCNPQLGCKHCNSNPSFCQVCPTNQFKETTEMSGVSMIGCSSDCKTWNKDGRYFAPRPAVYPTLDCLTCREGCSKCEMAPTLKQCSQASPSCQVGANEQLTKCLECKDAYFLEPNKEDPVNIVPTCMSCGPNCKKCKDRSECLECLAGWVKNGDEKDGCTKVAPVAATAFFIHLGLVSSLLSLLAW